MIAHLFLAFFVGVLAAAVLVLLAMPVPPGTLGTEKQDDNG